MKRKLIVLALALIPSIGFAQLQVGTLAAFAPTLVSTNQSFPSGVNFPFGIEARFKFLFAFQLAATTVLCVDTSPYGMILTDIGATVDLPPFTLSAGAGPNLLLGTASGSGAASSLINFKLSADWNLGSLSVGFVVFDPVGSLSQLRTNIPWFGLTALFALF